MVVHGTPQIVQYTPDFDIAQGEAEDMVQPDSVADDLRWEAMAGKVAVCGVIRPTLPNLDPTASRS